MLRAIIAPPVRPIDPAFLETRYDLPHPRLVVTGVNAAIQAAAADLALFSELPLPWTAVDHAVDDPHPSGSLA